MFVKPIDSGDVNLKLILRDTTSDFKHSWHVWDGYTSSTP